MRFTWPEEVEEFRQEVREFARKSYTPEMEAELREAGEGGGAGPTIQAFREELETRGWARQAWPIEYGGGGKSPMYHAVMTEEFAYTGLPAGDLSLGSVAPAIMNYGTDEQKAKFLPDIVSGKVTFAIGYSEPNAGTDLAALQLRAVKDGDEWVLNGQKIWTSAAHVATHVWLAARTDPDVPKHRGISMFILPLNTPGITVRPIFTMGSPNDPPGPGEFSDDSMARGRTTNEVFYEDVRIPADALIGEVNRGWYITANALDYERVSIGPVGRPARVFDTFVRYLKDERPELLKDPQVRLRLAGMKVDLHRHRAFSTVNTAIVAKGETPTMEASMAKVSTSELTQRMYQEMMDMLGRAGAQRRRSGDAPLDGALDEGLRGSPPTRFAGGTNEIQRNIIAQRGLGLPR